jgi:hypothetical protein
MHIAKFIRAMVERSTMPADDNTQGNITAAKQWLDAVASGTLVVTAKKTKKVVAP